MNKPVLLLMAPVQTVSGYGARGRDLASALIEMDKYDVKIWPTRWGATPMNALDMENPKHQAIQNCILAQPNLPTQPEVFIQLTVPNEFQRLGKYNIGITAGIETTLASGPWIEGCNRMDLVLISSEFSKKVFQDSAWQRMDQQTQQVLGELKLEKPIEVLMEGVNLDVYKKLSTAEVSLSDSKLVKDLNNIKESFAFLFVGHWLNGDFGQDRKNVATLIQSFLVAFKGKTSQNRPALILKTSHTDFSPLDRSELLKKLDVLYKGVGGTNLPNIYLVHGDLTDEEMNLLYNHPKVKAHVTFTKGEGFGRPLAEASLSGKPIIASNWSGHLDFLKHAILLPGSLNNVHPSAAWNDVILQDSQWFDADPEQGAAAMRHVFENYKDLDVMTKKQASFVKKEFSYENMAAILKKYLDQYVPEMPVFQPLKMPTLKKIELPKLTKL
jgi:glycosyltransferase involved in cell wall biosynthesis